MPVEYRRMRAEDEYQAFVLWANTFGSNDPEISRRYISPDPHYRDHTLLAVLPDGTIAATLHYWLYPLRDASGTPRMVGAISHVATPEEHRRHSYASALLQWSFADMRSNGCEWTLLFSSEMGVPLYRLQSGQGPCVHAWGISPPPHSRSCMLSSRLPQVSSCSIIG